MNIYQIQIRGNIEIDEKIEADKEYSIALKRIQNKDGLFTVKDNTQDGKTYTYKMINLDIATLISGNKIISGKPKKGSLSQKLRVEIENLWSEQYSGSCESEAYYEKRLIGFINQIKSQREELNN